MTTVEKLSITLTPELARDVRMAVKSGEYASSSEVIREALRDWHRKRAFQEQEIEELRGIWRKGVESGKGKYDSIDEIKQAARDRLGDNSE